jgi:DMSO/TMAO reductase YedYZ molybdopterin-dependent catalytic subunit
VTERKAWIVFGYDGEPLEPEHRGPARMLVPHLYFRKSAKWVRRLRLQADDEPGFWEDQPFRLAPCRSPSRYLCLAWRHRPTAQPHLS